MGSMLTARIYEAFVPSMSFATDFLEAPVFEFKFRPLIIWVLVEDRVPTAPDLVDLFPPPTVLDTLLFSYPLPSPTFE